MTENYPVPKSWNLLVEGAKDQLREQLSVALSDVLCTYLNSIQAKELSDVFSDCIIREIYDPFYVPDVPNKFTNARMKKTELLIRIAQEMGLKIEEIKLHPTEDIDMRGLPKLKD